MPSAASCALVALAVAAPAAHAAPGFKRRSNTQRSTNKSSIKCTAIAFGSTESYSKNAFVKLGADYAKRVCGDGDYSTVTKVEHDIAVAYARATATTYVSCESSGSGVYGHAQATSRAETDAAAYAKALGEGWASVETCYGCKAAAELFVDASKNLFVKAVAESSSELEFYGDASGGDKFRAASEVVDVIEKEVANTFVAITADVKVAVDDGEQTCAVRLSGCAVTGDEYGCCDLAVGSTAQAIQIDAIAEVATGALAQAYTCGDSYQAAAAETYAEAIAEAWARAVSVANGWCESTERGNACSWGKSSISVLARAQAEAFAEAYATVDNACNCNINVETVAYAFEEIFVQAHSEIATTICALGGDSFVDVDIYAEKISHKTVTAIAEALATATANHEECSASASSCAAVGSDNYACCDVSVDAYGKTRSVDAYAEAGALAGAFSCADENSALDSYSSTAAAAVAEAYAAAIVDLEQVCASSGYAGACSLSDSYLDTWAKAEAKAVATAWASTAGGCECDVGVDLAVEAFGKIFVEVANDVKKEFCVIGNDYKIASGPIVKSVLKQKVAIAEAIAWVQSSGVNCAAGGAVGADVVRGPTVVDGGDDGNTGNNGNDGEDHDDGNNGNNVDDGNKDDKDGGDKVVDAKPLPAGPVKPAVVPDVRVRKGKKVVKTKRRCTRCQKKVNRKCGGRGRKSVRGCCGKGVVCVRRNKHSAVCKNVRSKGGRRAVRRFKKRGFGQRLKCYTGGKY